MYSNLNDALNRFNKNHCKDNLIYRYPSQLQLDEYCKWSEQFKDITEIKYLKKDVDFRKHWKLHNRLLAYNMGKYLSFYNRFIWVKENTIRSITTSVVNDLKKNNNIAISINTCRSLLEQISTVILAEKKLSEFFDKVDNNQLGELWLVEFEKEMKQFIYSTKINWEDYYNKGLRKGSRGTFDEKKGHHGIEAQGLMSGVDLLSKKVKGVRKAYEFASEFTHPNVGVFNLFISDVHQFKYSDGLILWERKHVPDDISAGEESLQVLISEYFEICSESIEAASDSLLKLKCQSKKIKVKSRILLKKILKNEKDLFAKDEFCPCLSGKKFRICCSNNQ